MKIKHNKFFGCSMNISELGKFLCDVDNRMDSVPIISTVNNIIDIVEKIAIDIITGAAWHLGGMEKGIFLRDRFYLKHLDEKKYSLCLRLLIPFYNIKIAGALNNKRETVRFKEKFEKECGPSIRDFITKWDEIKILSPTSIEPHITDFLVKVEALRGKLSEQKTEGISLIFLDLSAQLQLLQDNVAAGYRKSKSSEEIDRFLAPRIDKISEDCNAIIKQISTLRETVEEELTQ